MGAAGRPAETSVRTATRNDERRLAALDRVTWSPAVAPAPLWPEDVDFFEKDPPEDVLVAELDGAVVGYVKLRRPTDLPSHRHVLQVNGLAVDPAVRRRGVGRALLVAALEEARRRGARRLTLNVLATNPGARTLYADCGFVVEGVRRGEFPWRGGTWTTSSWPCPWSRWIESLDAGPRGDLSPSHRRDVVRSAGGTLHAVTDERWTTPEELAAARERMEAAVQGYERPAAFALGLAGEDGAAAGDVFPRVNSGANFLPAVVLATACGHVRGTATYVLDEQGLQRAIDLLAPAEACTELDHPNLAAWRQVRAEMADRPGAQAVAVFLGDLEPSPADGRYERLLRDAVAG